MNKEVFGYLYAQTSLFDFLFLLKPESHASFNRIFLPAETTNTGVSLLDELSILTEQGVTASHKRFIMNLLASAKLRHLLCVVAVCQTQHCHPDLVYLCPVVISSYTLCPYQLHTCKNDASGYDTLRFRCFSQKPQLRYKPGPSPGGLRLKAQAWKLLSPGSRKPSLSQGFQAKLGLHITRDSLAGVSQISRKSIYMSLEHLIYR
jgi:hypothetical protein